MRSDRGSAKHISRLLLCLLSFLGFCARRSQSLSAASPPGGMKYSYQPQAKDYDAVRVASLHRYAVKGLSGDSLTTAVLGGGDGTLEDDRRFALLYDTSGDKFDGGDPEWLHKVRAYVMRSTWCGGDG